VRVFICRILPNLLKYSLRLIDEAFAFGDELKALQKILVCVKIQFPLT